MQENITIGLAADHELMRTALKHFLFQHNYCVSIEAVNGNDLIMKLQIAKEKPLICILDANMPILSGCETVKILKVEHPDIKIIAFSVDPLKGKAMLRAGADDFLQKSSLEEAIIERISKLVELISY